MLKKIIKLLFIFLLFIYSKTYSDFVICDSGNINYEGITVSEICNGGYENVDISLIESFTGSYVNFDLGFWGSDNNLEINNNIENNFPVGFFDTNKKTVTENVNPEYTTPVGFIGINNTYSINSDVENNFPMGFFDTNKKTIILKTDLEFTFPVGYLGNYIKTKSSGGGNHTPVIQSISYRDFFEDVFRKNIDPKFLRKYSNSDFDLFINNLLDVLFDGEKDPEKIISEVVKNRIELYIKNHDFKENLNNLINNLDQINDAFEITKNNKLKLYVIKYYLN